MLNARQVSVGPSRVLMHPRGDLDADSEGARYLVDARGLDCEARAVLEEAVAVRSTCRKGHPQLVAGAAA
jgi:hypothetical protein